MSRSFLIHRLTALMTNRVKQNHKILTSLYSSSAAVTVTVPVCMTDNCIRRLKELHDKETGKMLRLSVETGGCSGFQYAFLLDDKSNSDDRIFEKDGVKLVVDNISYDFVKGATVDYVEELIRSAFVKLGMVAQKDLRPGFIGKKRIWDMDLLIESQENQYGMLLSIMFLSNQIRSGSITVCAPFVKNGVGWIAVRDSLSVISGRLSITKRGRTEVIPQLFPQG
ncbi:hypothetical protein IFM89_031398 [Coptis chinensis]|uniref:Core domain-containing protein n=1 Tax=Coptis chinensis TaxID=261450 RepID=A0A835HDZ1_9MAGN|nr:hypothetical protein IFM89_031398 [Coptis chinensis]